MDRFAKIPRDILINLALELDLPDIISYCRLSKRFDGVTCQNDIFWMNKFHRDFGQIDLLHGLTWKQFYQKVVTTEPNDLLLESAENNLLSLVKVALSRGADIHYSNDLVEQGADIHVENDHALRWASQHGHLEVVKYLVEQGADIHVENDHALRNASRNGHLEVVKYLVEQRADIHSLDNEALRTASQRGHLEVVKYLVEQGADIHALDNDALRWANQRGHSEVAEYLYELGRR